MYQTAVAVDLSRATLHDLVEDFVRLELGFGDREFAVNSGEALLYDVEETDNLGRKLVDLGALCGNCAHECELCADDSQASRPAA
jgi:ubiquitin-like 1-activating enzyme E1 B